MQPIEIDVNLDSVIVCGQLIRRPSRVPRSIWVRFWEAIRGW
jgi:hypothetical protein